MLGEGARTEARCATFFDSYAHAIDRSPVADGDIRDNPGYLGQALGAASRATFHQRTA
jgi:hypothetical protein